jgi:hypothetical protein
VVGTAAAGVKDNLFMSGNSSDFRRRGDPARPEGEAGLDGVGEMLLALAGGIGTRRFGFLPDLEPVDSGWRGEPFPCWLDGVFPMMGKV